MSISDVLQSGKIFFSFEFFPPKDEAGEEQLYQTIHDLKSLSPAFVSVTYGAMGTNQDRTLFFVKKIKQELNVEVMAHFTCVGLHDHAISIFLEELKTAGIRNVLALRGDVPEGVSKDEAFKGSYYYANELVSAIRAKGYDFMIGVAGYPEKHIEAVDLESDIDNLKRKVDAGADFILTQLFFLNDNFYRFRDLAVKKGITVPIIPGIMPIQTLKQIDIFSNRCGVVIPERIRDFYVREGTSVEDKQTFGIAYATEQCKDLVKNGVQGIHFYTLNKSSATRTICERLQAL